MRRTPTGPSCRPAGRSRVGLILALSAALTLTAAAFAQAQATRKAAGPPDLRPLARYVPKDNLVLYLGSDGLNTQPDAWKKTAAYRMLNETNLGVMLEDMTAQFSAHALERLPNHRLTGADVVAVVKHLARFGFVFAVNQTGKDAGTTPPSGTLVVRSVVGKDAFGSIGRLIGTLMGSAKTQKLLKAGRYIVVVPVGVVADGKPKATWTWWVEKDADLVVAIGKGAEDATMAVIDGKTPNALDNPVRSELARAEGGFTPLGQFFVDPSAITQAVPPAGAGLAAGLPQSGVTRFDYRWGFQDEALMAIARLKAPRPRRGLAALLDQPAFEKGKLPPLPEGLASFTVASAEFGKIYDQIMASPPSSAKAGLTKAADELKSASRVDLRNDLLGRLLPKFAVYVMPGGAAPAATAPVAPAAVAVAAASGAGNPLGGLLGLAQLPRFTLTAEVDDNAAFGKTLDNLMVAFNKMARARAAEDAPAPKPEAGKAAETESAKARRTPPAMEFKQTPTNHPAEKSYVLNIPSALARQYPTGFRPTIRLKDKQLIVSTTPESARLALEVKAGEWTPPADIAPAFEQLPKDLSLLSSRDPRPTLPEALAGLPGGFQRAFNSITALTPSPAPPGEPAGAAVPRPPASAPPVAGPAPTLVFNIPLTRLPKAEELRERLFPGLFSVTCDDQEIRIVSRVAFPNMIPPSAVAGVAVAVSAMQDAGKSREEVGDPAEAAATTKGSGGPKTKKGATKKGGSSIVPPG